MNGQVEWAGYEIVPVPISAEEQRDLEGFQACRCSVPFRYRLVASEHTPDCPAVAILSADLP